MLKIGKDIGSAQDATTTQVDEASGSSGLPSMEKLDGDSNYASWKSMLELDLVQNGLWEYTSVTPAATDALGTQKDGRAREKICSMVSAHCLIHVREAKTAKDAWEALRTACEGKVDNDRCRLLFKLVGTKSEQFVTVRDYVTSVTATSQQLLNLGKKVDDELLAALIIQGLSAEFQDMRSAIENSNISLTTDYVKTKLFQMEDTFLASPSVMKPKSELVTNKYEVICTPKRKTEPVVPCFICNGSHKVHKCPDYLMRHKKPKQGYALWTIVSPHVDDWIIDSGASTHMTNRASWFEDLREVPNPLRVTCADGNEVLATNEGTVVCKSIGLTINNVMYIPHLTTNLLSVNAIAKKGHVVVFTENGCEIFKSGDCQVTGTPVVKGIAEQGIYKIKCGSQASAHASKPLGDPLMLWHRRMGHLGMRHLKLLRDGLATGITFPDTLSNLECACLTGLQINNPFESKVIRATEVLGLVHAYLSGPMEVPSICKSRYFLTFIDDFTRKTFVYFLEQASEVFAKFVEFKEFVEKQCGNTLKILRTSNGVEFANEPMDNYLSYFGIQLEITVECEPEQNDVAVQVHQTICRKARSILQDSDLAKRFWAEAVKHIVFLKNRSPTLAVMNKTPEELWSGRKCDLDMVVTFGCKAFLHLPQQNELIWDPRGRELIHVGFCDITEAYRLMDPITGEVLKAKNVIFIEN